MIESLADRIHQSVWMEWTRFEYVIWNRRTDRVHAARFRKDLHGGIVACRISAQPSSMTIATRA
jgi:hypothetical protein